MYLIETFGFKSYRVEGRVNRSAACIPMPLNKRERVRQISGRQGSVSLRLITQSSLKSVRRGAPVTGEALGVKIKESLAAFESRAA